ncbi:MAG: hypothetical protein LC750_09270 [Actinobacteria bacterium]|nr:hypothetical protein [Actinomycetota bacterium]
MTSELLTVLEDGPEAYGYEVGESLGCDLGVDHPESHHAIGLEANETQLRICWTTNQAPELVELSPCDTWHGKPADSELCLFLNGHSGAAHGGREHLAVAGPRGR